MKFFNVLLLIGIAVLTVMIGISLIDKPSENVNLTPIEKQIVKINNLHPAIEWNNNALVDHTNYDQNSNVCIAENLNMKITIEPCFIADLDGKNIQQYVDFEWNGVNDRNTTWLFIYEGGELLSGSLEVLTTKTNYHLRKVSTLVENVVINNVVSYENIGNVGEGCDYGNMENTQRYSVTRSTANQTQITATYCFETVTPINANSFSITGYDNRPQLVPYEVTYWKDVTNQIEYLGDGLLGDNRKYYRIQDVEFSPDEVIQTRWSFTPDAEKTGKFHILGYESEYGLVNSVTDNRYIYVDPWWDNSWLSKRDMNFTSAYSVVNFTYVTGMNSDFSDFRLLDYATETTEQPYWIQDVASGASAIIHIKNNVSQKLYYNNGVATTTSDIQSVYPGIKAYYPMDEGTSTSIADATGIYNITSINGVWGVGKMFTAFNPNGASSGNTGFNVGDLTEGKLPFTITFWINRTGTLSSFPTYIGQDGSGGVGANGEYKCYSNGADMDCVFYAGGGQNLDGPDLTINTWTFITVQYNDTGAMSLYYNLALQSFDASMNGYNSSLTAENTYLFSSSDTTNKITNVYYDDVRFYNYSLSSAEKEAIYYQYLNGSYTLGDAEVNNGLSLTLSSPANNTVSNNLTQVLNATFNPAGVNVTNYTITVFDSSDSVVYSNQSLVNTNNSFTENWTVTFSGDDVYVWNVVAEGTDLSTDYNATSPNWTFTLDTNLPTVNIVTPLDNSQVITETIPVNVDFNISVSDDTALNNCWYYNDTANTTITCGNNATVSLNGGNHTFIYYANDTAGNVASNETNFFINFINTSVTYNTPFLEVTNTTISLNVTASLIETLNATINYNGTNYTMSGTYNSTDGSLTSYIVTPEVTGSQVAQFVIYYTINGFNYTSATYNQTINELTPITVATSCNDKAVYYKFQDEQNFTDLNGTVEYNFKFGTNLNYTANVVNGTLTNVHDFYLCINATASPTYYIGYGEVQYSHTGYVERRNYLFEESTISNNSLNNIVLYQLLSTAQTSFRLEIEDTSLNPYVERYTALLRWYPNINNYEIVEMGFTDEQGETVMHVQAEDVDYRIAVYEKNGSLIKLEDPTRMVCLVDPCTYTMRISPTDTDYTSFFDVDYTFTYNQTTGIWTFTYSDSSQLTSQMNLTIYKLSSSSVLPVCSDVGTSYTGVLTCNTSVYSGELRGEVRRSASPNTVLATKLISTTTTAFSSAFGLWLSFLIGVPIVFLFAFMSPVAAIVGGVIALIPALAFKTINLTVLGGFALLAGIIAHFLKRIG